MKKIFAIAAAVLLMIPFGLEAKVEWTKVEASELGILGKPFADTPNPYHRIDTVKYKGFTTSENRQCRMPAGYTVLFKTDADRIGVSIELGNVRDNGPFASYQGFDLYIKKDGSWLWAGRCHFPYDWNDKNAVRDLVTDMAPGEKECILYFPLCCELLSCQVCVPKGCKIEKMESQFRHRIVFHGSSFTHGISTTRSGMSYPMQFMRRTGLQVVPLGFSGNCKMQPYFADVLADVEADAYVFDPFSNPSAKVIKQYLMIFIDRMVKAHPGKPMIFQKTIYWEKDNFNTAHRAEIQARWAATDSIMSIACQKYKDVYYLVPDAARHDGESSTADGVHPNDHGYSLWEQSIEAPLLTILFKYGIR